MFYTRAFLSSTLSPSLFALNFKSAFTLSFSCKSPPEWIFSHLLNQALLACSQTMNKHISTQMNAVKQARNEETRRRNMRVHNCQRSQFGFVARQLCGHHRNIYGGTIWADRDLTALSDPRANPTRQIYKPRYARRAFGPPRFARNKKACAPGLVLKRRLKTTRKWLISNLSVTLLSL